MKKILLSLMFCCLSATMIFTQNLITNGDFESWTDPETSMPSGWLALTGHYNTYLFGATDLNQGNILRLKDEAGISSARRFSTTSSIAINTDGIYRVTFKVKGNVGLRGVILVKGSTSPSTSTQSATNHYTLIADYPSGTIVSDWTTLQYDISIPSSATFGTDYRLHFSWSSSDASKPGCDFYVDDVSLVKYVEALDDRLSKIEITPLGYTPSSGTPDMTIPGFNSNTQSYTFTSSYKNVPVVSATAIDATALVDIVQATSLTGTQAERSATITVTTTDDQEKIYSVEFVKHPGFISGMSWDTRGSAGDFIDWETTSGLYTRTANQSAGNIYAFGNTSARCNSSSTSGYHLTTPILANGASTVSFYLKNTDIATDNSQVVVKKSTSASPDWTEIGRVQPNTSDYNNVWKQVTMNIHDNSSGLKIRFEFEKTIITSGTVFIDDILIERGGYVYAGTQNASDLCTDCDLILDNGGQLNIDQESISYNSITVRSGAKITVIGTNTLSATNGITLESDANGTATIMDNYETPTLNATVKQYVTAGRNWYMSAPLNSANVSALNKGASVQQYNETTGLWEVASGTMTRGKGYIQVANSSQGTTGTVEFTGTTNSGNVPVTLTNNSAGGKGFNLVGNPYPSYLKWGGENGVVADNAAANMPTGTMWYRTINYNGKSAWAPNTSYSLDDVVYNGIRFYKATQAGTSAASGDGPTGGVGATGIVDGTAVWSYEGSVYIFATVNADGQATPSTVSNLIPPMQAFWVKSNGGTLTFKNAMRQHESVTNRLKAPGSSNALPFVRLSVSNGASVDEALIYASENASNTFDSYDAPKYFNTSGSNQAQIYTSAGTEKLAINALNSIEEATALSLGFVTETANSFDIRATEVNTADLHVILLDNHNANEFDLTNGDSYVFSTTSEVNDANRFTLIFRAPDTTTALEKNINKQVFVVTNASGQIEIHAPDNSNYIVFNAMGQKVTHGTTSSTTHTINNNLSSGMYVVKVNDITGKVIIK